MTDLSPDVCVVGSGPAGIAVALGASARGKTVLLAESGDGLADLSDLNEGAILDASRAADRVDPSLTIGPSLHRRDYLRRSRARRPGGASTLWRVRSHVGAPHTVRIARPRRVDFAAQPRYDVPPWPIEVDELDPYLDRACEFFGLGVPSFVPPPGRGQIDVDHDVLEPRYFYFPRASAVFEDRLAEVAGGDGTSVRTGWTLVDVETNAARSRVTGLHFATAKGDRKRVEPKTVAVAAGGIENAAILLNAVSDGRVPDPYDNAGRWFMDHPHIRLGAFVPNGDVREAGRFHDFHESCGQSCLGYYSMSSDPTLNERLLRFSITLVGKPREARSASVAAGLRLVSARYEQLPPWEYARRLLDLVSDPAAVVRQLRHRSNRTTRHSTALGGWGDPEHAVSDVEFLDVESMSAQRPSRDHRIRLGVDRNALGKRRPALQWSWSYPDLDSFWRSVDVVGRTLTGAVGGRFYSSRDLGSGQVPQAWTGWHQMGGTRMSTDPKAGVVDVDCRHHQVENLYFAGSSVFPSTLGYSNPTLSLVALSLRLGDHLA